MCLSLRTVMGSGMWIWGMYYAAVCTEGIASGDIAMSAVFIDMLKSHWNVSRWPSPIRTVSCHRSQTRAQVIRDLLFGVCVL